MPQHHDVIIVGAGQAGLSLSHYLQQRGIDHLLLEKHTPMHAWRHQRWDAFCLVTPNWQCKLPGHDYAGPEPHGFMKKAEIIDYLDAFLAKVRPPLMTGVTVRHVKRQADGLYAIQTSAGAFSARQVVVCSGGYHEPVVPRLAERLPAHIVQLHSEQYRNPQALPEGGVLVVGIDSLMTQLAKCCKPAPPDEIGGFVTRGKGVSIHRADCSDFAHLQRKNPDRVIDVEWSGHGAPERDGRAAVYPVDVAIEAQDRQGLLRDISDVFAREKMNVIGVQTQSVRDVAWMTFTIEVSDARQVMRAMSVVGDVPGVRVVRRK